MTKTYTAEQREDAATALAIVASSCTPTTMGAYESDYDSDEECDELYDKDGQPYQGQSLADYFGADFESEPGYLLAEDAYMAVPAYDDNDAEVLAAHQYAEAEAWVRSGWSDFGDEASFK